VVRDTGVGERQGVPGDARLACRPLFWAADHADPAVAEVHQVLCQAAGRREVRRGHRGDALRQHGARIDHDEGNLRAGSTAPRLPAAACAFSRLPGATPALPFRTGGTVAIETPAASVIRRTETPALTGLLIRYVFLFHDNSPRVA